MTSEQRVADFRNIADVIAKNYAPYEWKKTAFGTDPLDIGPWLARVEEASSDVAFWEICAQYVASLQDTHTYLLLPSTFQATLGFTVDVYEGKILIDSINRTRLPEERYPFQVGDELVAVDGRPAEEIARELAAQIGEGNPHTTYRTGVGAVSRRFQALWPRSHELPDESSVTFRRESGETADYRMTWSKTGIPVTSAPSSPAVRFAAAASIDWLLERLPPRQRKNWRMPEKGRVMGLGATAAPFALPAEGFTQRLGTRSTDRVASGIFEKDGVRIGYLRVPQFPGGTTLTSQVNAELTFFRGQTEGRANTDGLILDLMRNVGGSACQAEDLLERLIPEPWAVITDEIRVTWSALLALRDTLAFLISINGDPAEIAEIEDILGYFEDAYKEGRPRTAKVPLCSPDYQRGPVFNSETGEPEVYRKPIVMLVDEFTASAAEVMAAVLQDTNRVTTVGKRTAGAGGATTGAYVGAYSEAEMSLAFTIGYRQRDIVTPDLPTGSVIENIGIRPDVELDIMTRENLVNKGKPFLDRVLELAVEKVRNSATMLRVSGSSRR